MIMLLFMIVMMMMMMMMMIKYLFSSVFSCLCSLALSFSLMLLSLLSLWCGLYFFVSCDGKDFKKLWSLICDVNYFKKWLKLFIASCCFRVQGGIYGCDGCDVKFNWLLVTKYNTSRRITDYDRRSGYNITWLKQIEDSETREFLFHPRNFVM